MPDKKKTPAPEPVEDKKLESVSGGKSTITSNPPKLIITSGSETNISPKNPNDPTLIPVPAPTPSPIDPLDEPLI